MTLRPILCIALTSAALAAQEPVLTRQIDVTLTEGSALAAAASPDRQWIAIDLVGGIWVLPFGGGEAKRITPDTLEARQPAWSPDNRQIAFQGLGDDGTWHIYVVRRDGGEPRAITRGMFDDREPAWSHDGQRIAFSSDRFGGISTIWVVFPQTGDVRQVSERDATMPAWSPDDRALAFIGRDHLDRARFTVNRVYALDASGRETEIVPSGNTPLAVSWSPDGVRVAQTDQTGVTVWTNRRPQRLMRPFEEDIFPFRPQWLSNNEILYTADGGIRLRTIGSARARTIPFTASLSLHRDTYAMAHRPLEPTGPQPVRGILSPVVAPDGRAVAFVALGDLWLMPIVPSPGAPIRITNNEAMELDPAWSPDSSRIAYASDASGRMQIVVQDLQRVPPLTVVTDSPRGATRPAWSPDGNHLAYLNGERTLEVVTLVPDLHRGTIASAIVHGTLGRPTWSGDNHTIAAGSLFPFSNRHADGLNQLLLFRLDPPGAFSTALATRSAGNRADTGPVWSPDGTRMTYVSEGTLWNVPVDAMGGATGLPIAIAPYVAAADELPESPSWERDMRHLVYQTPGGLRRMPGDGGVPDVIPVRMTWAPARPAGFVVVHAGHIFDGVLEALGGETDIVVDPSGIIREIGGHRDELHSLPGGRVVSAPNETVMPGLIDMHARVDRSYGRNVGRALLAYGVTTVRVPGISAYAALAEQEAIDSGRRPGPRLITSGDRLEGARVVDDGGAFIASDAQLDLELDRAGLLGSDFIATGARLPDKYLKHIVAAAHLWGTPVAAPALFPGVGLGVDLVDRLGQSRTDYQPAYQRGGRRQVYQDVVETAQKTGLPMIDMLALDGGFDARLSGDRTLLFDPRLALFDLPLVARLTDLATKGAPSGIEIGMRPREAAVKSMFDGGVRLVAASGSPGTPYGLGLHAELASLVRAGLSPYQALQLATIDAARALGLDDAIGTIEVGKLADFAFVDGDPLIDIRNARKTVRVMKGGRVYTVEDLIKR